MSTTTLIARAARARLAARPDGYPLVGQLPHVLLDPLGTVLGAVRARPDEVACVRLGPYPLHVVSHPDHVQQVLGDSGRSFGKEGALWQPLRRLFGDGLVVAGGETWLRHRRMMQPMFSAQELAAMIDLMAAVVDDAADALAARADRGERVDLGLEMMRLTQRALVRSLFGDAGLGGRTDAIGDAILEAFRILSARLFLYFLPDGAPLPGEAALRRAIRTIDEGVQQIVIERRRRPGARGDLLSLLLAARDDETKEGMSDRQIRDELVTLLVAGSETTAQTMAWVFYLLDRHPDVDRRMREELTEVLGDRPPTAAALHELRYMRWILQETLRLYPPGWMLPRSAREDVVVGGARIPKGSALIACAYATHHDPRWWPEPSRFDPDRFRPEEVARRPRYAFYPWGGGPRQCIGNQFSILEAQVILAILTRRFRFRLAPGHPVELGVATTLKPKHGMEMILSPADPVGPRAEPSRGNGAAAEAASGCPFHHLFQTP